MSWLARLTATELVREARDSLDRGVLELSGLGGPARVLIPLLLTEAPLLVVTPRERDVESLAEDLETLAREAGRQGSVHAFPAPGPPPFRGLPRHPEASLRRAATLHAAGRDRLAALVASPAGLLRPTLTPSLFATRVLSLRAGEELTPEILLEALDEGGYRRQDPVTAPGEVARRGGILDFFPPDRDRPVRLEFVGDTIESLRAFDPATQRTVAVLDAVEVLPICDVFATRSVLDHLRRLLPVRFPGRREVEPLLEKLERGLAPDELSELIPLVPGATVPAWDHAPGLVPVVLDPEAVALEAEAYHDRADEDRRRYDDPLSLEPAEALVSVEALAARLAARPAMHLREVDTDGRGLHFPSRPVRRYAGDLRALVGDLRGASSAAREIPSRDLLPLVSRKEADSRSAAVTGTSPELHSIPARGPAGESLTPEHLSPVHLSAVRTVLYLGNAGRAERLKDVLAEEGLAVGPAAPTEVRVGALSGGFELPAADLLVLADGDVFPEEVHLHPRGRSRGARSFLSDFRDLKVGDLVVHQDHGIGRYEGLETLEVGGTQREFMVLRYQAGDKLKVPVDAFDRIQKYASAEGARPVLDKLGSGRWEKVKRRVKKAMRDMAAELLRLYAERKARPGHAFTGESPWQREFEESFEYEETPDQAASIEDVSEDMASDAPMDRLICGDVGYGKTEVAMRAAMRAVLDGKQVAVLAPTTVLAFQHWKTFRKRFAPFPVAVEMVSRFRSPREIKGVLQALADGKVDVLIGTHRLLSKDVLFRELGLMIIDEEQRFGVAAKERLKTLRKTVDCLTLSATPIPRTLQMGLAGIRDMSVIETPPKDRLAIQTSIVKFSTDTIAAAIRQELSRDGQVYFVHDRVDSIYSLAEMVQRLVPEARVVVGHGQMPERELEKAMLAFVEGRADILVATTIIENGLDIPRVNTILVNRADRFGLAQLYQLRGRVGRSDRRAYAFLLVPPDTVLSEIARKRLAAIREFSELGAGFRIAALDLELRGAGNLLGGEQSGHIEAVGLDLYVKLLEQTVLELKGEAPPEGPRATLNLGVDLRIPGEYVPEPQQRMSLYKRVSQVRDQHEIDAVRAEIRDRYGPSPVEVDALLRYASLRLRAEALGISQIDRQAAALHLRFAPSPALSPELVTALVRSRPGAALTPQGTLRLPVSSRDSLDAVAAALEALEAETRASAL